MTKTWGLIFGIVFLLIGILGFVPGITTEGGNLLGIFQVDAVHNIIHILTGIIALAVMNKEAAARLFFQIFGVVYALVTIVGFVQSDTVLGLFGVNLADNILHLVIALVALYVGFAGKSSGGTAMGDRPSAPSASQDSMGGSQNM